MCVFFFVLFLVGCFWEDLRESPACGELVVLFVMKKFQRSKRLEGRMIFLNFTRWWFRIFFIFSPTWEDDPM